MNVQQTRGHWVPFTGWPRWPRFAIGLNRVESGLLLLWVVLWVVSRIDGLARREVETTHASDGSGRSIACPCLHPGRLVTARAGRSRGTRRTR